MSLAKEVEPRALIKSLQEENAALRQQVSALTAERDSFRRFVHTWAKSLISPEEIIQSLSEERVAGSLMDFINEAKGESAD